MNRRGFLKSLVAFGIANAIPVKAIAAVAQRLPDMPVGTVVELLGADRRVVYALLSEHGFVIPDGRALSRDDYPKLFAVLGETWGAAPVQGTFKLPDFRS